VLRKSAVEDWNKKIRKVRIWLTGNAWASLWLKKEHPEKYLDLKKMMGLLESKFDAACHVGSKDEIDECGHDLCNGYLTLLCAMEDAGYIPFTSRITLENIRNFRLGKKAQREVNPLHC
jgi:hypothetical protein